MSLVLPCIGTLHNVGACCVAGWGGTPLPHIHIYIYVCVPRHFHLLDGYYKHVIMFGIGSYWHTTSVLDVYVFIPNSVINGLYSCTHYICVSSFKLYIVAIWVLVIHNPSDSVPTRMLLIIKCLTVTSCINPLWRLSYIHGNPSGFMDTCSQNCSPLVIKMPYPLGKCFSRVRPVDAAQRGKTWWLYLWLSLASFYRHYWL